MCAGRRYKKTQRPKSLKGARRQVNELEESLAVEEDALSAIRELNEELDALQVKRDADAFQREYLPESLLERLTDRRRETEQSKRGYAKWLSREKARDEEKFEVLKKYFFRIARSSLHGDLANQHSHDSLQFDDGAGLEYSTAPQYCNRGYLIKTGGPYVEGIINGLKIRLENAKENLVRLEAKAAREAVKKAQVAAALGTTRNLAGTIKNDLPADHDCPYCGGELGADCHADHIYPVSKGGQSRAENMVNVCARCNSKKSDMTLSNFIRKYTLDRISVESRLERLGKEF